MKDELVLKKIIADIRYYRRLKSTIKKDYTDEKYYQLVSCVQTKDALLSLGRSIKPRKEGEEESI